jgi:2-hydroxychromene-2-carboxylate isomerase
MTGKTIEFVFDFGSPNAYLALPPLGEIAKRHGAAIKLIPCLLGGIFKATNNRAPMIAFGEVPSKLAYERLEMERFIARHDLTCFRMNPHFPVNTLLAMRGMVAAQRMRVEDAYVAAVLAGMWEDGEKMDDPEVFVRVLDAAGLDGRGILERTRDDGVKAELAANTEAVVARGAFGIPTFFVNGEMFFGKDRLAQVEEQL